MIFFTSDTHFNHARALELMPNRIPSLGINSIEEMNDAIIERFNNVVCDTDTLIFMGDFLMGMDKEIHLPNILTRLNGIKHLVIGNHDPMFRTTPEHQKQELYLQSGFKGLWSGCVSLNQIIEDAPDYLLCHFPYHGSVETDHNDVRLRFDRFYPPNQGKLLLHGHTHSLNKVTCKNSIHIGVESWNYYPVSLEEIDDLWSNGV